MYRFIESIQLNKGEFCRLNLHQERVGRVFSDFFPDTEVFQLTEILQQVEIPATGIHKCRIVFDNEVRQIDISPYTIRRISTLKTVETLMESMAYKTEDRRLLNKAFAQRGNCDDVLLIKKGLLTDTSYSNIALLKDNQWYTPAKPLIYGTNRAQLLIEKKITEIDIRPDEIPIFQSIRLFNAMTEFGEIELSTESIMF